jgi:hypothetical protein
VYSDFYEIPLPALRFEKVEETDTKVKVTPKRMTPSKSTMSEKARIVRNDKRRSAKKSKFTRKKRHAKETKRFQNNVNKRFQTTTLTRSEQRI